MPVAMAEDVRRFGRQITPLVGPANVSYTPGVVLHIWHGDRANRDYRNRYQILISNRSDPDPHTLHSPDTPQTVHLPSVAPSVHC